ncbi:GOLGA3 [Bugula neritina]|uniref:GOLGA3 n=1 Tax=Bugula neritina TaxID=10212 RepID=A0A7J7J7A0_BUGNE|nr:GOLGA3 [Bugula neritina]
MSSRRSSCSEANGVELVRIPINNMNITKEKVKSGGRGPVISRETSKPSRGGSTQTSGRTTPVMAKPPKMMSEAAIKVTASLRGHNDRLRESPDRLNSVFNAEYNVSPVRNHPSSVAQPPSMVDVPATESSPVQEIESLNTPSMTDTFGSATSNTSDVSQKSSSDLLQHSNINYVANGNSESQLIDLMKKNAELEGRIEMLSVESETAIKDRAKYQRELGALKSQLLLFEKNASASQPDTQKESMKTQQLADDLKRQVADLQKQLTTKTTETVRLNENLHNTQELNAKLQATITSFGQQIKDKDLELFNVGNNLRTLELQVGSISDDKQTNLDKISSLQDDVTSLTETKEWYQQQLHSAQELRNNLQTELTKLQNLVSTQADTLERVKVENSQLKHQLGDTQHKALAEKELLIRHLEAIEADMLEREAGFEQMEKEKGLTEYTWQQKMMQIEKERMALGKLMSDSSDLQRELQKAEHDLKAKVAEVSVLETQQADLNKRLVVAQQTQQATARELEYTKERLIECETTMNKLQKQDRERGGLLQTLKQEKAALQTSLDSALEEKKSFAKGLETLKANTSKVEQNYRQMKQELAVKSQRVDELEKKNAELCDRVDSPSVQSAPQANAVPAEEVTGLQQEYLVLQEHLNALRHNVEDSEDRAERLSVEKRTLEQQLTNMKSNAAELEHILQKKEKDRASIESKLHEALATIDSQNKSRKSDENMQQKYNIQQTKMEQVQAALLKVEASLKDRISDHNTAINLLSAQLQEAIIERDAARQSLRQHEETVQQSSSSHHEHLYSELQSARSRLETAQLQKAELEKQISSYHTDVQSTVKEYQKRLAESTAVIAQLQQQLVNERAECEASISRHRSECETSRQLSMDLEKERGRLSALKDQHNKVKQHAVELEAALAQRESVLVQLSAANQTVTQKHDQLTEEQMLRVRQLEEDLSNQTSLCDSLKAELNSERQSQEESKELADTLKLEVEMLKQELDKKSLSLVSTKSELGTVTEMVEKQSTNIAMLNKEYRSARIELEQLRRSASETAAKNPIICDEMQALQWQVKQKIQETKDAESQLKLCEQRMEIETEGIRKALAETKKELDCIKLEMETVRKEKFSYQSRVAMLRAAVKELLKQCKVLTSTLAENQPSAVNLPLDEARYEELLKETSAPGYKSKPLENLKSCLSSLHSEMAHLQQHMDQHKSAIQTNNESWRTVETEVADLEKLIHASREATKARTSLSYSQGNVV